MAIGRIRFRSLVILLAALASFVTQLPTESHAQTPPSSPEKQLIDRYVPLVNIREQQQPCAPTPDGGEPYLPLPVELVLENDQVVLRNARDRTAIDTGVSAQELATHSEETFLDFPGNSRRPGCTFETDERARIAELDLKPTAYARIVLDPENERMIVQYWLFWYFNDWNNLHEADWEGVIVFWDSIATVEEALVTAPDRVGLSQHGGGELSTWDDDKLSLDNETHPVIFPAAGSHGNFYTPNTYLGWGENGSGFGCDVSTPPSERVELTAVLIPDEIDPGGEFAWLLWGGRWGEQQPSVFNGVHGPGFNSRWRDPWGTTDNWRDSSIVVPGSNALGPTTTDFFCAATHIGSQLIILPLAHPWLLIPAFLSIIGLFALLYLGARTYFRRARILYQEHWRIFVGIGLIAVPIGIIMNVIQRFVIRFDPLAYLIEWLDDSAGARLTAVLAIGGVQQLAMVLIISPAVIQAVKDIREGGEPGVKRSYALGLKHFATISLAVVVMLVTIAVPLLVLIGFPIALWLLIRWQFYNQVIVFDDEGNAISALRESSNLVDGRWLRTLTSVFMFNVLAVLPGILVGFGLLTLGQTAVGFANGVSSILYALLIPLSVIAITLLFLDRRGAREQALATT